MCAMQDVEQVPTDAEVCAIVVAAMADSGVDPALVYAFQKTGIYICAENEDQLPKSSLSAFNAAVEEYHAALRGPTQ
jgi:hypothetical protein